jgi:hypothetical protein
MTKFRVPQSMVDDETTSISIQSQQFEIDSRGNFEAPDHFIEFVAHLGVTVAPVDDVKTGLAKPTNLKKG